MTAKEIIYLVCDYFHVDVDFINTSSRDGEIIKIKHLAVYFIKKFTELSHTSTGRLFIGLNSYYDHASITHALKAVSNRYDTDSGYRKQVDDIDRLIKAEIHRFDYYENTEVFMENNFFTN